MTVMSTDNSKTFHGSGGSGPFTWTWRFLKNSDIRVYLIAGGVRSLLSEGPDYALTGAGSYVGGSLTLTFNLNIGEDLVVQRYTSALQPVSIRNQGNNFRPEVHEDVFDMLAMIQQDRAVMTERSLLVPEDEQAEIIDPTEYDNRPGKVLGWNSLGKLALMAMNFVTSSGLLANPWADVRGYASLADAVSQLGGLSIDLHVPNYQEVTADLTIPANIRLVVKMGGTINVAVGVTLTIIGPLDAGLYPIFTGSGVVKGLSLAHPEWFYDGSGDYSAAINAAENALSAGGELRFSATTYYVANLVIHSLSHWRGAGKNVTVIKLIAGANADLLKSAQYDSLTGTNSLAGDYSFSIAGITFDGNKTSNALGSGAKIYGYSYRFNNVVFRNFPESGLITEWSSLPDAPAIDVDFVESYLSNVSVHDNGGDGIIWGGPHDSVWNDVIIFRNSGAHNVHTLAASSPLYVTNSHAWGNQSHYEWYCEGRVLATNSVSDGGTIAGVYFGAGNSAWIGGEIYAVPAQSPNVVGIALANNLSGLQINTTVHGCYTAIALGTGLTTSSIAISNYQSSGLPRTGSIPSDSGSVFIFNSSGVSGYSTNRFGSIPQCVDSSGTLRNLHAVGEVSVNTIAGAQTIDVSGRDMLTITSAVAASIYNFTNAGIGQEIILLFKDANTTITNGSTIKLAGGVNFVSTANDVLRLKYSAVLIAWVETGRSLN